jgi:hypothetical protein
MKRKPWLAHVFVAVVFFALCWMTKGERAVQGASHPCAPDAALPFAGPQSAGMVPSEIGVSVPNGAGGHTYSRFVVRDWYRDSDVRPELGARVCAVALFYLESAPDRYRSVIHYGQPIPKPGR